MAIIAIELSPVSIHSGGTTTLSVQYSSHIASEIKFRPGAPFRISPPGAKIPPDPDGNVQITAVIERIGPHASQACDVVASDHESSLVFTVVVR